jgi:thiol-disulfide isomerase/thioredoxin
MRFCLPQLSFFLLAVSCVRGAEEPSKDQLEKIRSLYGDARAASIAKEYAKSIALYVEVLGLLPKVEDGPIDQNRARVHYEIGTSQARLGETKTACEHLEKAVGYGFWEGEYMAKDEGLASLAGDKTFAAIVEKARRALPELPFGLKDLNGKVLEKKDHVGKVLVIDVWGTWCPPCRMEIPSFVKLQEKYGKDGLLMIGLTWEKRPPDESVKKRVEAFAAEAKVNYPLILLSANLLSAIPRLPAFPTTFYVGRDGLVAERVQGAEGYEEIEAKVLKLLKAPKPESK